MMRALVGFLAVALTSAPEGGRTALQAEGRIEGNVIATNECFAKGGLGIVNSHIYIPLDSNNNELILDEGRWAGKDRGTREIVVLLDNRIVHIEDVPSAFSLGKAIIVSFEGDVVRFFDAPKWSGGYYRRTIRKTD